MVCWRGIFVILPPMPPRKTATNPNGITQTLDMIRQHESLLGPDERAMLTALAESLGQRTMATKES